MGDMERLHRIKYLIQARQCVPLDDFLEELDAYRESKSYKFVREYYFDITSFYGK
jgi:hypothetical protein